MLESTAVLAASSRYLVSSISKDPNNLSLTDKQEATMATVMGETCFDCMEKAATAVAISQKKVFLCAECFLEHSLLRTHLDEGQELEGLNDCADSAQPWEVKSRPIYLKVQKQAYIQEKYVNGQFTCDEETVSFPLVCCLPFFLSFEKPSSKCTIQIDNSSISVGIEADAASEGASDNRVPINIKGRDIRYATLMPSNAPDAIYIALSFYVESHDIQMYFMQVETYSIAFKLLNAVRRLLYNLRGSNTDSQLMLQFMDAHMFCRYPCVIRKGHGSKKIHMLNVCIDPECFWMSPNVIRGQHFLLLFHKEDGPNVVNDVVNDHSGTERITVTIWGDRNNKFSLRPNTSMLSTDFDLLKSVFKKLRPKPHDTFRDSSEFARAMERSDLGPPVNPLDPSCFVQLMTKDEKYPEYLDQEVQSTSRPIILPTHRTGLTNNYDAQGASWNGGLPTESDPESFYSRLVLHSPEEIYQMSKDPPETLQVLWAVAESEIGDLDRFGLIRESKMESGGLDPNSLDHFRKCVDEIKDAVFQQNYHLAGTHARGTMQVYRDSARNNIRRLVTENNLLSFIKTIFLVEVFGKE